MMAFVPKYVFEPFEAIVLQPGESTSDTLATDVYVADFRQFPGYIEVKAKFLITQNPWAREKAISAGTRDLRLAVPVP
jgi:hypothetical protein